MAISVTDIGVATSPTSAASLTGVTVPAGSLIVVAVADAGNAAPGGSVTDGSNTYSGILGANVANTTADGSQRLFYAFNSVALSGATITYSGTTTGSGPAIAAFYATGLNTSSDPHDAGVDTTATGTSSDPSVTSGSPAGTGELFVALNALGVANGSFTQDSGNGWSTPPDFESGFILIAGGNQVNAGGSAKTFAPKWSRSAPWSVGVTAFKAAATATSFGWFEPLSDPTVRTKRGLPVAAMQFSADPPWPPVVPFGWFEPLSDPVRVPARLRPSEQQFAAFDPNPVISFGWFEPLSQPVPPKPWLHPAQMQFEAKPVAAPGTEVIPSMATWFVPLTDPVVRIKPGLHPAQMQDPSAAPERLLPTPNMVGALHATEFKDTDLFTGTMFARPVTGEVGVIEAKPAQPTGIITTTATPVGGVVENAASPTPSSPVPTIAKALVAIRQI